MLKMLQFWSLKVSLPTERAQNVLRKLKTIDVEVVALESHQKYKIDYS